MKPKTKCPLCGKAMGYSRQDDYFFGCHQCGIHACGGPHLSHKRLARKLMERFIAACRNPNVKGGA